MEKGDKVMAKVGNGLILIPGKISEVYKNKYSVDLNLKNGKTRNIDVFPEDIIFISKAEVVVWLIA